MAERPFLVALAERVPPVTPSGSTQPNETSPTLLSVRSAVSRWRSVLIRGSGRSRASGLEAKNGCGATALAALIRCTLYRRGNSHISIGLGRRGGKPHRPTPPCRPARSLKLRQHRLSRPPRQDCQGVLFMASRGLKFGAPQETYRLWPFSHNNLRQLLLAEWLPASTGVTKPSMRRGRWPFGMRSSSRN